MSTHSLGVFVLLKRLMSLIAVLAMLVAVIPQAGLAMSAEEALFGEEGYNAADVDTGAIDDTEIDPADAEDNMYGDNDTAAANIYPTLRLGDSDSVDGVAYIVFMQNRLIELGYLNDEADGYFGDNTQTAIKEFQKSNGLQETGIADPSTQERLYSDASTLVRASDTTVYGSDVMRVQNAMHQWGFMFSSVDGKMGKNTATAIKSFKEYMFSVDPTFGVTPTPEPTPTPNISTVFGDIPVTNDMMLESAAVASRITGDIDDNVLEYVDGQKNFRVFRQVVRSGDKGDEVLRVQKRLKALKYLYSADGSFGSLTEHALMYFQYKHGLEQTGVADQATQERLFSASAMESEEYVFPYKIVVDISDQRVYVGSWNGTRYKDLVRKMVCSTGKSDTPTPTGTYQAYGKAGGEWYYFKDFNCYAKWGYRIVGGILFHSVTYSASKKPTGSIYNLGHQASHGCIRLKVEDAKWIYDNCPRGTTVVIQR